MSMNRDAKLKSKMQSMTSAIKGKQTNTMKLPALERMTNSIKTTADTKSGRGSLNGRNVTPTVKTAPRQSVREHSISGVNISKQTRQNIGLTKTPKTSIAAQKPTKKDKNYIVKRDRYDELMQDNGLANDIKTLAEVNYNNANQDATVSKEWAEEYGAKAITGGLNKKQYLESLSRRYNLTPKELEDMALTFHSDANKEEVADYGEGLKEFAEEHPVLGSAGSFVGTLGGGIEGMYNVLAGGITGDDRYLSNMFQTTKKSPREGAKENIDSGIGKGAYDIGMGIGDMAAGATTGSAPAILAGNTANEALESSLDRNNSVRQASIYGAGAGALDYITESIGLGKADDLAVNGLKQAGLKQFLKNSAKAGKEELTENVIQNIGQQVLDAIVNDENSELNLSYRNKLANGEDVISAFLNTAKEYSAQLGFDALLGYGMGSFMQGGASILPALSGMLNNKTSGVDAGKIPTEDVEIQKIAQDYQNAADEMARLQSQLPELTNTETDIGPIDGQLSPEEVKVLQDVVDGKYDIPETGETAPVDNTQPNIDFKPSIHNADGQLLNTVKIPEYKADSNVFFNGSDTDIALAEAQEAAIIDTFNNIISDPEFNALSFKNGKQEVYVSPSTIGNGYRVSYTVDGVPTGHHDYSLDEMGDLSQKLREMAGNGGEDIKIQRKSDSMRQNVAGETAPANIAEQTPKNPTITSEPIEGADQAKARHKELSKQLVDLNKEIAKQQELFDSLENKKSKGAERKAAGQKLAEMKKQAKAIQREKSELSYQMKGEERPYKRYMQDYDKDAYNAIYGQNGIMGKLDYATHFAGDTPEAIALRDEIKKIINDTVQSGEFPDEADIWNKVEQLDSMARTAKQPFTSKKGKNYDYDTFFAPSNTDEYSGLNMDVVNGYHSALRSHSNKAVTDRITDALNSDTFNPVTVTGDNGQQYRIEKGDNGFNLVTLGEDGNPTWVDNFKDSKALLNKFNKVERDGTKLIDDALQETQVPTEGTPQITETPNEMPNVKPTEPQPRTPDDIIHLNGMMPDDGRKTSKYYKNTMRNTEENVKMSDEEYGSRFKEEDYKYNPTTDELNMEEGRGYINEAGGHDAAVNRLLNEKIDEETGLTHRQIDAGHILADEAEKAARELESQGQDASEKWLEADRVHKKLRRGATINAQAMQALKKWKDKTPRGAVDNLITEVNRGIDEKKTPGYTSMVEDLADDVEDAINSAKGENVAEKIKDVFANNRKNSSYNTKKYEQQVLKLVGGKDANKRSSADLAAEAARIIKRGMGVSTLTGKEERAMINLLEEAAQYPQNSRSYKELVSRAMMIYDESLPSSVGNKFKSLMYDNMLASLKTMFFRNFGGNVLSNAIENVATPFQVGIDKLVSLKTGARSRTFSGNALKEGTKGLGKGFKDVTLDALHRVNTTRSGQETLNDTLNAVHKNFKTGSENRVIQSLNKVGNAYDYTVKKIMEGGDRPIYEAKYAATKAELYDIVDRFGDEGIRKGLPKGKDYKTDDLIELIAVNEALESVLQNDSTMKEGAKALKKAISKSSEDMLGFDIASMSTVPFVEVPANMASRFFQYTPVGVLGNIVRTRKEKAKYGEINQRRFSGETGRNILGGLMTAGAMGLAKNKFISGPYSEDKDERKLQQNNNYQEYALQTPDENTQIDISDVPVLGPMLRYGKMQYDALQEGGVPELISNTPRAIGSATIDTLYQGLNKLTGASNKYSSGDSIADNAWNALMSSLSSLSTPSVVRQTAQFLDPYKRDLGDYGTKEYNVNSLINGLPKLRESLLEPKIDTSGNEVKELGGATGASKFAGAYLTPWKITHPNKNISDAQRYAQEIKAKTNGEVNPQPPVFNAGDLKKTKGYDAENYSHEDLRKIQEDFYSVNTKRANELIDKEWFTELPYDKQGKYLDELYSANKELAKENIVREGKTPEEIEKLGDELYTGDSRLTKILRDSKSNEPMLEYFQNESDMDALNEKYDSNMDYDTYVKWKDEKQDLGGPETYAANYNDLKALKDKYNVSMNMEDYLDYQKTYPGGPEKHAQDSVTVKRINEQYGTKFTIDTLNKYGEEGTEQRAQGYNTANDLGFIQKDGNVNYDRYNDGVEIVGNNPTALQAYNEFKNKEYTKNKDMVPALRDNNAFTAEQKGKIIMKQHGYDYNDLGKTAKGAYDIGGEAGVYYYYMLKDYADANRDGSLNKNEKAALRKFMQSDSPYVTQIPDDVFYYLGSAKW